MNVVLTLEQRGDWSLSEVISGKWSEDRAVIGVHVRSMSRFGEQKVMSGEVLFWFLGWGFWLGVWGCLRELGKLSYVCVYLLGRCFVY